MWSDKELDDAFRRLAPPEPEAESFPLDAWLRLEQQLDKTAVEREFRRRLWRFFAAEMLVVAVGALLWLAWPVRPQVASAERTPSVTTGVAAAKTSRAGVATATAQAPAAGRSQQSRSFSQPLIETSRVTATASSSAAAPGAAAVAAVPASASSGPTLANSSIAVQPAPGAGRLAADSADTHSGHLFAAAAVAPTSVASKSNRHLSAAVLTQPVKRRNPKALRQHTAAEPVVATKQLSATHPAGINRLSLAATRQTTSTNHARRPVGPHPGKRGASVVFNPAAKISSGGHGPTATSTSFNQAAATTAVPAASSASQSPESATATAAASPAAPGSSANMQPLPVALQTDPATALPTPLATLPLAPTPLPEPLRQPRFYLGLLAAPDVSTVKMADYQAPTPNLGVLLEYRLTNRLRVNTGLLRSTKQYRARKKDYDWSYYPIALTGNFEWVDGRCTILDVPLNLRYDVLARPRYQVFGSAGLSSLFMQHETYAYDYEYYGQLYRWESSFTNKNQHWFSVLNLSAGYERNLGQHWRLQVEPYVKLPLGGVGAGKVRLMSGGVFFGVKYGL